VAFLQNITLLDERNNKFFETV